MLSIVFAFFISYVLHAKDVFGPPTRPAQTQWTAVDGAFDRKPVSFHAADNVMLRGWLYPASLPGSTYVIFFYGSNEDLVHEQRRLQWLSQELHVNAICFDYRGYGFSEGAVSPALMRNDVLSEYDYVVKELAGPQSRVVSYGWSVGSQFAIHLARERAVAALTLQAPPASAEEMSQWSSHHDVPRLARGFVHVAPDDAVREIYQGAAEIRGVKAPLLVIQGERDDVVPIEQGREVFAACPSENKRFLVVPNVHHNDVPFTKPPAGEAVAKMLATMDEAY